MLFELIKGLIKDLDGTDTEEVRSLFPWFLPRGLQRVGLVSFCPASFSSTHVFVCVCVFLQLA